MNTMRLTLTGLLTALLALAVSARAADIDIYGGLSTATGVPNVLAVMDNAADFSSSSNVPSNATCQVTDPSSGKLVNNSLAGTVGGIEQCAFYQVLQQLPTNSDGSARINIGFMVYNSTNQHDWNLATSTAGTNCGGSNGGCLVVPLTPLTNSNRTLLLNWITTWQTSNGGAGSFWMKASGEATAAAMQEAWAYYAGQTGISGRNYSGIQPASGCQKNFVIFIGDSWSSSGTPGDGKNAPNPESTLFTASGSTSISLLTNTVNTQCQPSPYTFTNNDSNHLTGGDYADEWARFMLSTDIYNSASGTQNIITYTVGLLSSSCQPSYEALLANMARYGGGKYFASSDTGSMVQSILKILNEVQAVNSVFSSATLPVSVNTQGTYLNQVFMGMFRPDSSGFPRWVGNVKQYQFSLDNSTIPPSVFLSDVTGKDAISSSGTGFISSNAISFWTCTSSTRASSIGASLSLTSSVISEITCPSPNTASGGGDPAAGFFASNTTYTTGSDPGLGYDLQDGELVDKGGSGQQVRLANLIASYPAPTSYPSTSTTMTDSPRNLYVYCPGGANCVSDLTDPSNSFSVNNSANISASLFGSTYNLYISSATHDDNGVATIQTVGAHGLKAGSIVNIYGINPTNYNGQIQVITSYNGVSYPLTSNTFSYALVGGSNPVPKATGTYTASLPGSGTSSPISSMSRTVYNCSGCSADQAIVTVNTSTSTLYTSGETVNITNVSPGSTYSISTAINCGTTPCGSTFTYQVPVLPTATATASKYTASNVYSGTSTGISSIALTLNGSTPNNCSTTATTYSATASSTTGVFHLQVGDTVTVSDSGGNYGGTYTVTAVSGGTSLITGYTSFSFDITWTAANSQKCPATGRNPSATAGAGAATLTSMTTVENSTSIGTGTVTVATSSAQFNTGDSVNITWASNTTQPSNEAPYSAGSPYTITCSGSSPCSTFTFPITMSVGQPVVSGSSAAFVPLSPSPISSLTASGSTATAVLSSGSFSNGASVYIAYTGSGAQPVNETNYDGTFTITCSGSSPCSTFTFPVTVTPATPATSVSSAYVNVPFAPDPVATLNWIRGQDNVGDELSLCPGAVSGGISGANYSNCPSTVVTVRPSVHGDALHSRPIAVNYGSNFGVVVFYGTNDGVYHAINGNQSSSIGNTLPGGELWGWIKTEDLGKYTRLRTNSPLLLLPSTPGGLSPAPAPKDYFVDGPTGLYQAIDGSGNTQKAVIYVGKRRGGSTITALDVTTPTKPVYQWKLSSTSTGTAGAETWNMYELGQTWSLPKVMKLAGYANPVVVFGGGYDNSNEDTDPPGADTVGRGIYILDAVTGQLVWSATPDAPTITCSTTICEKQVTSMQWSVPSDIAIMDSDGNGTVDRMYVSDTGGNVWRIDLEPPKTNLSGNTCSSGSSACTPDIWQVTKLAALGCATGTCASGTTPRKFFYPPEVLSSPSGTYTAVIIGSGDREKPLYGSQNGNTCTNCAWSVTNRLYMLKDTATSLDGSGLTTITESALDDCTGTAANPNTCSTATTQASSPLAYNQLTAAQQHSGYYVTLCNTNATPGVPTACPTGEKAVNAPLAAAGYVYFGTNQPTLPSKTSCTTNLGIARGYQISPFSAAYGSVIYSGGGLPPSPVAGIVDIVTANGTVSVPFLIGGASPGCNTADCLSAVGATRPKINVPTVRHKTYWYLQGK
jgi:type IV pilus assembly protein PilY1